MAEFEDIRIAGFDKEDVSQGSTSALFNVPLRLSQEAPRVWCEIFGQMWSRTRYTKKRHARATSREIVIEDTGLDEVDKYHIKHLNEAVASTNERYRDYLKRKEADTKRQQGERAQTQSEIDDLEKRLDFDHDN